MRTSAMDIRAAQACAPSTSYHIDIMGRYGTVARRSTAGQRAVHRSSASCERFRAPTAARQAWPAGGKCRNVHCKTSISDNGQPASLGATLGSPLAALDAFYRFTRPHTMLGTTVSVMSVSALALQGAVLDGAVLTALVQALSSALLVRSDAHGHPVLIVRSARWPRIPCSINPQYTYCARQIGRSFTAATTLVDMSLSIIVLPRVPIAAAPSADEHRHRGLEPAVRRRH